MSVCVCVCLKTELSITIYLYKVQYSYLVYTLVGSGTSNRHDICCPFDDHHSVTSDDPVMGLVFHRHIVLRQCVLEIQRKAQSCLNIEVLVLYHLMCISCYLLPRQQQQKEQQ